MKAITEIQEHADKLLKTSFWLIVLTVTIVIMCSTYLLFEKRNLESDKSRICAQAVEGTDLYIVCNGGDV